jgi:membrane protease YdiL (CAAX protease family)
MQLLSLRNTLVKIVNKKAFIYSVFAVILLVLLEQLFGLQYISKQVARIILFVGIPLVTIYFIRGSNIKEEIQFEKPTLKELKIPLISSLVIFLGTIGGYALIQFMFDASKVVEGLEEIGIGMHNVWLWGIYLSFINSLIEEFFFRGYVYFALEKKSTKLAIVVSSIMFSFYHVVLMISLFDVWTVVFTVVGLFIVGVFLAYINRFGKSFINSWIIHISADIAVVLIGIYMFTM